MTPTQKRYLVIGAAIVGVVALVLVLSGRAEGSLRPPYPPCRSTTTTTGLVPEISTPALEAPGEDLPELRRRPVPCRSTTTTTATPGTLSPSTTICRIGEDGRGTYPNGEPCGEEVPAPVEEEEPVAPTTPPAVPVKAQPTYTG